MKNLEISQQQKIQIAEKKERKTLELGAKAVDSGFLKNLPGVSLHVLIYLLTHLDSSLTTRIEPKRLTSLLPSNLEEIKLAISRLEKKEIIFITNLRNSLLEIKLNPENLLFKQSGDISTKENNKPDQQNKNNFRKTIINNSILSEKKLKKALLSYLPSDKNKTIFRKKVNKWLNDFEPELIRELIKRVEKWLSRRCDKDAEEEAFYYLQGIIKDWYKKDIYTKKKLKYFDRLFRETGDLAEAYGINRHYLKPAQLDTFRRWLTKEPALEPEVIKYAIKEAIKRKKDGQPSLKYIEDNFIKPWKRAGINNIAQAKKELKERNSNTEGNHNKNNKKYIKKDKKIKHWDNFHWDEL